MRQLPPPTTFGNGSSAVLDQYEQIHQRFHYRASDMGSIAAATPRAVPSNGKFYQSSTDFNVLGTRVAGFDKLFMTLIQGIVDDPDYALRKDRQIYQRMMRDPQIYYCLMVRKTATSSLPWQVVPPDEYSEDAQAVELAEASQARLNQIPQFRELLNSCLNAFLPGISINELMWKVNDAGEYIVYHHEPKDKDRFKFDKEGRMHLLQPKSPTVGIATPGYKFITHRFQVRDGSWMRPEDAGYVFYGQGLADTPLYHYFYFKVTALRFMLKNLERNSSPFKIYYTGPQNAQLAAKLDQILAALQNDSVVGIPGKKGETNVDVAPARGGAELYIGLIEYVDRLITRAILGQELMTEMPSVGSYAAAQVHASVFSKITENDRDLLQDTLNNSLMRYDAELNTPEIPQEMRPVFRFKSNAVADVQTFLATVQQAQSLGIEISENQVRELSGLREPGPNERPLQPPMMGGVDEEGNPIQQPGMPGAGAQPGGKSGKPGFGKSAGNGSGAKKAKEQGQAEGAAVEKGKAKKAAKKKAKVTQ